MNALYECLLMDKANGDSNFQNCDNPWEVEYSYDARLNSLDFVLDCTEYDCWKEIQTDCETRNEADVCAASVCKTETNFVIQIILNHVQSPNYPNFYPSFNFNEGCQPFKAANYLSSGMKHGEVS